MGPAPRAEVSKEFPGVQQEIARLSALPEIRSALAWFRTQEPQFAHWQLEMARIAAPPFGEAARGTWLKQRFDELGLEDVQVDDVGNVLGRLPGIGKRCVTLSAHIDTVFPAGTPLNIRQQGSRLYGPGVSDNGAGLTALLAVAAALGSNRISNSLPVLFVGNVGEEGEGDLRGMRHIFADPRWKNSITCSLVLDGAGSDTIVAEALGSRRFEVIVRGPGGHSWSDFGSPNPIPVLARAIQSFTQTPVPSSPKTTFNIGVIRGGTSVNSIPESASMRVDIRSTSMAEMERLERALRQSVDRAVEEESQAIEKRGSSQRRPFGITSEIVAIGNRPAGELDANSHILQVIRAVDAHLGNAAQIQRASTDANIPLSLGREAIAIGGGGTGGGAHTLQEWFDCNGRELGLKRILLTLLALTGVK
ncbi:MAG: M20/M25/M40 family metallo-hydrolase [Terriglobales bacterium]|jgi:acetylornithine deacetylase/succinyl-diaminopimelate desuccinylase-like protein